MVSTVRRFALDEIVSFCKRRGFIFAGSELYGGIGTGYDYGPYGTALKKNVQDKWWKDFVERRPDCVGIDAALLSSPKVWKASGHVEQFVDPLSECVSCRKRVRADKVVKERITFLQNASASPRLSKNKSLQPPVPTIPPSLENVADPSALSLDSLHKAIIDLDIACPGCGAHGAAGLGVPRQFNLLFKTNVGPVLPSDSVSSSSSSSYAYMRPETAQGAYIHFLNVHNSTRRRLPLGIGQIGRSFRNEIAIGNFVFRTREFDQAELEYFCKPADSPKYYQEWVQFCHRWLTSEMGLSADHVRLREYSTKELAHYALATTDIEYKFPFGWDELWGIANRGDFDLKAHSIASGIRLEYTETGSGSSGGSGGNASGGAASSNTTSTYTPHVVEPALGINRLILAILSDGLVEETLPFTSNSKSAIDTSSEAGSSSGSMAHTDAQSKSPKANKTGNSTSNPVTDETRTVFRVHPSLAPVKAAVLPLLKKDEQVQAAQKLHAQLLDFFPTEYDATQAIGKRYRRQDEIGTPFCITVDPQTIKDGSVTVRDRDSMRQARVPAEEVVRLASISKLTLAGLKEYIQFK